MRSVDDFGAAEIRMISAKLVEYVTVQGRHLEFIQYCAIELINLYLTAIDVDGLKSSDCMTSIVV